MSIDVTRTLRDGADRTASRTGATLVAAIALVAVVASAGLVFGVAAVAQAFVQLAGDGRGR